MNEIEAERQSDLKSQKELLNSVLPEDKNDVETTITIRLPASLKEALKADAESRGINLSDYVRVKLSAQSLPIRRRPRQQVSRVERGILVVVLQKLVENRELLEKGIAYAATPKISEMNFIRSLTAPFSTPLICPLRIIFIISYPFKVRRAVLNEPNPIPGFTNLLIT